MGDLIERLNAVEGNQPDSIGICTNWYRNPDGPEAAAEITRLTAEVERLREALSAEREDNLWNAYHAGHAKDGQWTHMFMSDGEWLARECGFDPTQGHYDDRAIRDAIPKAAHRALAAGKANP